MSQLTQEIHKSPIRLPGLIKELLSVAAARLDPNGNVLECNRGFAHLLAKEHGELAGVDVRTYFINPTFSELVALQSPHTDSIYRGIITIGDAQKYNRSLFGMLYRHNGELWLIAEQDLKDLEKLVASVIELNEELAQTYRDLVKSNQALKRKEAQITRLMLTDSLTGIPNRRFFMQELEREYKRSKRSGSSICIAICDVDHFKSVNDNYGHDIGDEVLSSVAANIENNVRQTDFAARWGGEEFIIMFIDSTCGDAYDVAERVRKSIESTLIESINDNVTISIGVTQSVANERYGELLKRADRALYESKNNGRNQVTTICDSLVQLDIPVELNTESISI